MSSRIPYNEIPLNTEFRKIRTPSELFFDGKMDSLFYLCFRKHIQYTYIVTNVLCLYCEGSLEQKILLPLVHKPNLQATWVDLVYNMYHIQFISVSRYICVSITVCMYLCLLITSGSII